MCFSVQVDRDRKKLAKFFAADIDERAYHDFSMLTSLEEKLGLAKLAPALGIKVTAKRKSAFFKGADIEGRVFANTFADVVVSENGQRLIRPMRYRLRPAHTPSEVPSKFNLFNARLDSLEDRQTWKKIFMKNHGLFPFIKFFEWVEVDHKKKLINFMPNNHELMWAPCVWDSWESKIEIAGQKLKFHSFALITDDPPPEISTLGHDRCPIFLKKSHWDLWLNPVGNTKEIKSILKEQESTVFDHSWTKSA